jgi:hypothetical protein
VGTVFIAHAVAVKRVGNKNLPTLTKGYFLLKLMTLSLA